ncbi:MAG: T9SS type A sorting domain-containing protein [Bacteroidales bacterium]|nr:T9SS type A sorting domain-containing protein [Bacteroidales bacterium]
MSNLGIGYVGHGGDFEVNSLIGNPGSMMTDLDFNYFGGESPHYSVDRIETASYSSELLFGSEDDFGRIIANETTEFKTVSSSIVLGAMANGDFLNLKPYVISEIVNYFLDLATMEQIINLTEGFQFISTNVEPQNPDMEVVVQEILNDDLDYIRDSEGSVFRKIGPNWVNGIGDWVATEGYLFKTTAAGQFTVVGDMVAYNEPIELAIGFQFISYLPVNVMDALEAFTTVLNDDLDFIRSSSGGTLRKIGPNWVNGIGNCIPGEGYLVKMFAEGEIIYPEAAKSSSKIKINPSHFSFEGGNAADPVYSIYIEGLEIGDEVAAYDGDILVGAMKITSDNSLENELSVFSTLNTGLGFEAGNPIILKVWNSISQSIVSVEFSMSDPYNEAYTNEFYPYGDGRYSIINVTKNSSENIEEIVSVYPNPFSKTTSINYIVQENSKVIIDIYNQQGQLVKQLVNKSQSTGVYNVNWNASDESGNTVSKGFYFYKINIGERNEIGKIILL